MSLVKIGPMFVDVTEVAEVLLLDRPERAEVRFCGQTRPMMLALNHSDTRHTFLPLEAYAEVPQPPPAAKQRCVADPSGNGLPAAVIVNLDAVVVWESEETSLGPRGFARLRNGSVVKATGPTVTDLEHRLAARVRHRMGAESAAVRKLVKESASVA